MDEYGIRMPSGKLIVWGAPHCPIDAFNYGIKLFEVVTRIMGFDLCSAIIKKPN